MKKLALILLPVLLLFSVTACSRQSKVLSSIGKYESEQIWTHGKFQDYTDFGIYTFSSANISDNEYFSAIGDDATQTINAFLDDFENLVATFRDNDPNDDLALNYSFDRSIIDSEDYFYLYEDESYPKYGCYDLWIFDTQTNQLYYFHNNI